MLQFGDTLLNAFVGSVISMFATGLVRLHQQSSFLVTIYQSLLPIRIRVCAERDRAQLIKIFALAKLTVVRLLLVIQVPPPRHGGVVYAFQSKRSPRCCCDSQTLAFLSAAWGVGWYILTQQSCTACWYNLCVPFAYSLPIGFILDIFGPYGYAAHNTFGSGLTIAEKLEHQIESGSEAGDKKSGKGSPTTDNPIADRDT